MKRLRLIGTMLVILLMTACKGDDETLAEEAKEPSKLNVYVYLPEHPIITRGDVGEVGPIDNVTSESLILRLQIWVFNSETKELIAYHEPESLNDLAIEDSKGVTYQLSVSEAFERATAKPDVDVYVLANVSDDSYITTAPFNHDTESEVLDKAVMSGEVFGIEGELTTKVPETGLPMAGVLRNATVAGSAPVYALPTLRLTRTVSKLCFVLCRESESTPIDITNIEMRDQMIPKQEHLFLGTDGKPSHIAKGIEGGDYVSSGVRFLSDRLLNKDIAQSGNPLQFIYQEGFDVAEYEALIRKGVKEGELTQIGPFYLRESDKKLSGTISYQVEGEKTEKKVPFEMAAAQDFSRNHTWIVYAYYGGSSLDVVSVYVKDWQEYNSSQGLFNW